MWRAPAGMQIGESSFVPFPCAFSMDAGRPTDGFHVDAWYGPRACGFDPAAVVVLCVGLVRWRFVAVAR